MQRITNVNFVNLSVYEIQTQIQKQEGKKNNDDEKESNKLERGAQGEEGRGKSVLWEARRLGR